MSFLQFLPLCSGNQCTAAHSFIYSALLLNVLFVTVMFCHKFIIHTHLVCQAVYSEPGCVNSLMDPKLFHTLKRIVELKYGICHNNPTISMGDIDSFTNLFFYFLYHNIDSRINILSVIFEDCNGHFIL